MPKLIRTFSNVAKISKNITLHTTNLPPLEVTESKFVMDRYLSPNFHTSKIENRKILVPTLKDYITFPGFVPDINEEVLR